MLLTPQVITKANVDDVVKAGALTPAQICKGIESLCASAGITSGSSSTSTTSSN